MKEQDSRIVLVENVRIKGSGTAEILVDTVTGVQYLHLGYAATLLVDENGKPLINEALKRPQ